MGKQYYNVAPNEIPIVSNPFETKFCLAPNEIPIVSNPCETKFCLCTANVTASQSIPQISPAVTRARLEYQKPWKSECGMPK